MEWLKWVLGFIQTDVATLGRTEKHRLFIELSYFGASDFLLTSFDPFYKDRQFSQNQMVEWEAIALDIQTALKQFIDQMVMTHATYFLPDITMSIRPDSIWPPTKDRHIYFQTHPIPKDLTPKNWAILNLSRLLQGLEMHVIGKCKECKRYFLNFSLRKKVYCSPRCSSRSLARTRKIRWSPEKYRKFLDRQKKVVMKRYVEKRKAQGKKVRHRPRQKGMKRSPIVF